MQSKKFGKLKDFSKYVRRVLSRNNADNLNRPNVDGLLNLVKLQIHVFAPGRDLLGLDQRFIHRAVA